MLIFDILLIMWLLIGYLSVNFLLLPKQLVYSDLTVKQKIFFNIFIFGGLFILIIGLLVKWKNGE